jgi:hypothetical protein
MITQAKLKKVLDYNPKTGVFTWLTELNTRVMAGDKAGSVGKNGYRRIAIGGRTYPAHRLAFLYMTGEWPPSQVDHKNGKPSDNRWRNLRAATPTENTRNKRVQKNNATGVKGVYFHKGNRRYFAKIHVDGKHIHLGAFRCQTAAHLAYCRAAKLHFGEFARFG